MRRCDHRVPDSFRQILAGSVACADGRRKRVMHGDGSLRTELRYKDGQLGLGQCGNRYTKAYKECQELPKLGLDHEVQ